MPPQEGNMPAAVCELLVHSHNINARNTTVVSVHEFCSQSCNSEQMWPDNTRKGTFLLTLSEFACLCEKQRLKQNTSFTGQNLQLYAVEILIFCVLLHYGIIAVVSCSNSTFIQQHGRIF